MIKPPSLHPRHDPPRLAKLTLEDVFWEALREIAAARGMSVNALVTEIDAGRTGNLSSAVRVFVLQALRD